MSKKIYARQINPEYQEANIFDYDYFNKIIVKGNDNFSAHNAGLLNIIEDISDELEAAELFIHSIYRQYIDYNPSEETYYWLDSTGHGKNGAPYEMIEVYNDMVECENMILSLYDDLRDYYREICTEVN